MVWGEGREICCLQCKLKKADGVIHSKSEGLKTRGANGVNSSLRAGDE